MTSHERDLWLGRSLQRVGITLLVFAFTTGFVLRFVPLENEVAWISSFAVLVLIILGAFLLYRGKQYAARGKARTSSHDDRPPVVYLRPFSEDESMAGQVLTAPLTPKMVSGFASHEEQLAEATAPIGPLVTVGRPGEGFPKPGATRAYASDDEWRELVNHWLSKARLVILRPGTSEGVQWELERAITSVTPDRFLVLMIHVKRTAYESFAESLRIRFGIVLPQFAIVRSWRRVSGFFEFGEDWKARFLPLRAPFWRTSAYKGMVRLFNHALQPVFLRLGVDWRPSPISAMKIGALGFLALPFFFCLAAVVIEIAVGRRHYEIPEAPSVENPVNDSGLAWLSSNVADLLISAPCEFEVTSLQGLDNTQDLMQALEKTENYEGIAGPVAIMVTRFEYKPDVHINVEGAVAGYINGIAHVTGLDDFQNATVQTRVSGYPAVRVSTQFTIDRQRHRTEALIFAIGQSLWQVHADLPDSTHSMNITERVIVSVTVPH